MAATRITVWVDDTRMDQGRLIGNIVTACTQAGADIMITKDPAGCPGLGGLAERLAPPLEGS